MTITRKIKSEKSENWFFVLMSRFPIFHVNLKIKKNLLRRSVATLFSELARFARGRIEDVFMFYFIYVLLFMLGQYIVFRQLIYFFFVTKYCSQT